MTGVQTCALPICFPVTIEKCRATYRAEICRGKFRGQLSDDEVKKLKKQEKCDICGGNDFAGSRNNKHLGKVYALVMDHNHENGKFRGMLCHHCIRLNL